MKAKPNEFTITRLYDAPVALVWDAWTDPKKAAKWWGPRGFTITTHSKELRPGGQWKYTMHGPDGKDWPNIATYHEVEKCSRLVYDHGATETTPPLFRVTALFKEIKGKTELKMTMTLETAEAAREIQKFIKQAGGNATWDRLAEYLEEESTGKDEFVINRSFAAPIATVFDMWTNPKHFSKWLAPTGFNMEFIKADIRTGGESFYMQTNGTVTYYGKAKYLEITPVHLLKYTQVFSDKEGNISRHPMAPTWPETMLTTVVFAEEDDNNTRVTVTWEIVGNATAEERVMFHNAKAGMTSGWTGSFDKLDEYLAK